MGIEVTIYFVLGYGKLVFVLCYFSFVCVYFGVLSSCYVFTVVVHFYCLCFRMVYGLC